MQLAVEYSAIAIGVGGALWLGNDSELGHTFWHTVDSEAVSALAAQGMKYVSSHKTARVQEFLQQHRNMRLRYTPTYTSWMNQVENWFARIQRDAIGARSSLALLRPANTISLMRQGSSTSNGVFLAAFAMRGHSAAANIVDNLASASRTLEAIP